jgi:hypothetical protein
MFYILNLFLILILILILVRQVCGRSADVVASRCSDVCRCAAGLRQMCGRCAAGLRQDCRGRGCGVFGFGAEPLLEPVEFYIRLPGDFVASYKPGFLALGKYAWHVGFSDFIEL